MENKKIEEVKELLEKDLKEINDLKVLNDLRVKYLGKTGIITELNSEIKNVANEDKKEFGMKVNELRTIFNDYYEETKNKIEESILNEKLNKEKIDISLPATKIPSGAPSILEKLIEEV